MARRAGLTGAHKNPLSRVGPAAHDKMQHARQKTAKSAKFSRNGPRLFH
jgi:hypothetical protein